MPLRFAKRTDFHPAARVFIETQPARYSMNRAPAGGRGSYGKTRDAEIIELTDFTSISTTHATEGKATGNITLVSHRDQSYRLSRRRDRSTRRQREISEYLGEVLKISRLTELDPRRRPLRPAEKRILGIPLERLGRLGDKLSYVIEQSNGNLDRPSPPTNRFEEYKSFDWYLADTDLLRRIWVDFRDREDRWVAGFTGVISTLTDIVTAGDTPVVSIGMSGMLRMYELTEFITKEALQNLEWPLEDAAKQFEVSTKSNILQGKSGDQILLEISEHVNQHFSLIGGDFQDERQPADFAHSQLLMDLSDPEGFGDGNRALNPERAMTTTTPWADRVGKLIIDPDIVDPARNRRAVYRQAVRTAFELYTFENASAAKIARDVALITNYEFFDDPKGNVQLWVPKYDGLPRLHGGDINPSEITELVAGAVTKPSSLYGEDYSTLPFHDDHYIIDDVGFLKSSLVTSEESVKTFGRLSAQPHWTTVGTDLILKANTGYTSYKEMSKIDPEIADNLVRLVRRFGIRRHTFPNMFTKSVAGETTLLTRLAYNNLVRINAYARSGTITMNLRPDLWAGRTVFLVERQRLAYIARVMNNYTSDGPHSTVLTLVYAHDPSEKIGQPWFEATEDQSPVPDVEKVIT